MQQATQAKKDQQQRHEIPRHAKQEEPAVRQVRPHRADQVVRRAIRRIEEELEVMRLERPLGDRQHQGKRDQDDPEGVAHATRRRDRAGNLASHARESR